MWMKPDASRGWANDDSVEFVISSVTNMITERRSTTGISPDRSFRVLESMKCAGHRSILTVSRFQITRSNRSFSPYAGRVCRKARRLPGLSTKAGTEGCLSPRASLPAQGDRAAALKKMSATLSALNGFRAASRAIDKYVFLRQLQHDDAGVFYRLLVNNAMEIMPYVYTPTVGEACQTYHTLPIAQQGVYITADDKGRVGEALRSRAPPSLANDLKVAVVTDGERILGLGDLGAGGMGIAEGKILLYSVCAGIRPNQCLPVCIDVGTDNKSLLEDPMYRGLRRERLRGREYDEVVEEFMSEMRSWQPRCLVQFEDFGNTNAFRILERYRHRQPCFNDDIQGTACIALAGVLSGLRTTGADLTEQRVLFYGAGEAGVGIGELIAMALEKRGMSHHDAINRCYFMDSKGLVCKQRLDAPQTPLSTRCSRTRWRSRTTSRTNPTCSPPLTR